MTEGIGARIRAAREATREGKRPPMKQARLADLIGVSRQTMSLIERGLQGVSSERLIDIIVALNLRGSRLLKLLGLRVGKSSVIEREQDLSERLCPRGGYRSLAASLPSV